MACQACGLPAPTQNIKLQYNVGMIIARRNYTINGDLCKDCIDKHFKEYQLKNLTLGWWGYISFFMTGYYLVANTVQYSKTRQLPRPTPGMQRVQPGVGGAGASTGVNQQQPYAMGAVSNAPLQQAPMNARAAYLGGAAVNQPMGAQSLQHAPVAPPPTLTQDTIARMQPVAAEYWARLCQGEPIDTLAPTMGQKAMVDAHQAWLYGAGMIKTAHDQAAQQQAGSPPLNT